MNRKILLLILTVFLIAVPVLAENQQVIKAGVSIDKIPKEFYGTWRVSSELQSSNNPEIFKQKSVDLWNLSRVNDVIKLDNPFSGAKASITVDEVRGLFVKFKKVDNSDGKKLSDIVKLELGKESFIGVNNIKLDTISDIDGKVIKSEWALYRLKGEKISGESIKE